jgi:hypothetical protein
MMNRLKLPAMLLVVLLTASLGCSLEVDENAPEVEENTPPVPPDASAYQPVTVNHANPRYLARGDKPMLFAGPGGPEDLLFHGARLADGTRSGGDQQAVIDGLALNGGDALYLHAVKSHGGDGIFATGSSPACPQASSCYKYANPFRNGYPGYPADPRILDQWYSWLKRADSAGSVIHLFLYDDGSCPWLGPATGGRIPDRARCRAQTRLIPEEDARLITPLVNRLKGLKNLVWVVAEEYSEALTSSRASAIARRIRALDAVHPVAVHQLSGTRFDFGDDGGVDVFDMQLGPAVNTTDLVYRNVKEATEIAAGRYAVVLAESAWQRALVAAGDRARLRQSNWAAAMAGAAGVLVYGMWEPTVPDTGMLGDLRRLRSFFESTSWADMSSAAEHVSERTRYARAHPGGEFILYSNDCWAEGVLGYTNVRAEEDYVVTWFDPIAGTTTSETRHLSPGANVFPVPSHLVGECAVWVRPS